MVVLAQLAAATALGGAFLLVAAGLGHLRDRRTFAAVLATQRLLPRRLRGPVAAVAGAAELTVGATAIAVWLAAPGLAAEALTAIAGCFATLGLYISVVRVRTPTAPCGCFGATGAVTSVVVARAWLFAVAAGLAATLAPLVEAEPLPSRLWPLMPAALVALTAWLVPDLIDTLTARRPPAAAPRGAGGGAGEARG